MKSINRKIFISFFLMIFITSFIFAQEWQWNWGKSITGKNEGVRIEVLNTDFLNNIYCRAIYKDSVFFPDTSFGHQTYPNVWNSSFAIYNVRGEFTKGIDIYSTLSDPLFNPLILSDSSQNFFVCTDFKPLFHLQNATFHIDPSSHPWNTDICLVKLNSNFEIEWSGLIHSYTDDELKEMILSEDGYVYIASEHEGYSIEPVCVSFFDQDTSSYFNLKTNSIVKIDLNGNLIWFQEIRSESSHIWGRGLSIESNDLIYFFGHADADVIIDEDTLIYPYPGQYITAKFFVALNSSGEVIDGDFFLNDIWVWDFTVNQLNEFYIAASIYDTVIINEDTIIVPEGLSYAYIGKHDYDMQPIWYEVVPREENQLVGIGSLQLDNDNLLFMSNCNKDVHIADTIISLGNNNEVVVGEFDPNGQLLGIKASESSIESTSFYFEMDNCENPLIAGSFKGQIKFGSDTLNSSSSVFTDGFVAKLGRIELPTVDIGPDSLYCEEHTLFGPDGYHYYSWNDSITNQNWHTIHESQTIYFACSYEDGCWLYDTINIEIHSGIEIDLGSDTTIRENDTVVFSLSDQYESYLWSNGSTSDKITIIGSDYGVGTFLIWIEVADGPCIESDTLYLTIISEFGINEIGNSILNIYPNPFTDNFTIEIKPDFQKIEIYDLNGLIKFTKEIDLPINNSLRIGTENLNQGIYILTITTPDKKLIKKIIKI